MFYLAVSAHKLREYFIITIFHLRSDHNTLLTDLNTNAHKLTQYSTHWPELNNTIACNNK